MKNKNGYVALAGLLSLGVGAVALRGCNNHNDANQSQTNPTSPTTEVSQQIPSSDSIDSLTTPKKELRNDELITLLESASQELPTAHGLTLPELYQRANALRIKPIRNAYDRDMQLNLLTEIILKEDETGNPAKVIDNEFNLAHVTFEIESRGTTYSKAIEDYKYIIKLIKDTKNKTSLLDKTKIVDKTNLIDDCYRMMGDMLKEPGKESSDIEGAVNSYLKGIVENGDQKEAIIKSIQDLNQGYHKRHKNQIESTIRSFYKNTKENNSRKILREALPEYAFPKYISRKDENRKNWDDAQKDFANRDRTAFKTYSARNRA